MMLDYAYWITQVLLALGALGAVYRVYKGPSVLDRVISVDVILIIVGSIMLADMAYRRHQDFILFVVVTAVIGFLGAVAIARYVAVRTPDSEDTERQAQAQARAITGESAPEEPEAPAAQPNASGTDESTSWFAALARSGFVPKRNKDDDENPTGEDDSVAGESRTTGGGEGK